MGALFSSSSFKMSPSSSGGIHTRKAGSIPKYEPGTEPARNDNSDPF